MICRSASDAQIIVSRFPCGAQPFYTTLGTKGRRPDGCHTPLCAAGAGPFGNTGKHRPDPDPDRAITPIKKAALRQQVDYCLFRDASSSNAQHTSSCFSSFTTTSFSTCCSFIVYSASIKSTRFLAGHQHIFYVDTHISLMSIIYIFYTPLSNISLTKFVFSLESSFIHFIAYISYKIFVHMY